MSKKKPLFNRVRPPRDLGEDEIFVQIVWRFRKLSAREHSIGASAVNVTAYRSDMTVHEVAQHLRGLADLIEKDGEKPCVKEQKTAQQ